MDNTLNPARLKFLCRRGMKELDEILNPFFDKHFTELDPQLQTDFAALLDQEEPTLFDWLVLSKEPTEPHFKNIVEQILKK
jgi:antitoxin CptB